MISVYHVKGHWGVAEGWDVLEVRHENKLTLDTITVKYYNQSLALIQYNKPYFPKYLGWVVEWIVNNRKPIGPMRCLRNVR